ncbi:MAG: hypothetical protein K2I23_02835, partial [Clostridia bacterium]|nr:hypothetical protein [Clostridia bacterium]
MKKINKCKKYIFRTCVVLIAIFILSIVAFNDFPTVENYENNTAENVELLATIRTNSPKIYSGERKYYSHVSSNATTRKYSQFTTIEDSSSLKASMTGDGTTSLNLETTVSNKNSKNAYFDFYTTLVVPALTEYKVTYRITYAIRKIASNGNASAIAKLYNYSISGDQKLSNGQYKCAESLYNAGTELEFNTSGNDTENPYWVSERISTTSYSAEVSNTYSWTVTYTNKEEQDVTYRQYYGYYGFIASATGYPSKMKATVSVSSTIVPKLLAVPKPTDVNTQYTGQPLSLADIANTQKTWYDASIMDLDYSENEDMVNVGTKRVKATIKPEVRNDENKFSGEIGEGEDEYSRYFNFVIDKKKIGLDIGLNTNNQPVWQFKSGAVYGGDTAENGRAPNVGFTYSSTDGKNYNSDVYPNAVGAYKATAKMLNNCNYELDDDYSVAFTVDKRDVAMPDVSGQRSVVYTGSLQEFSLSNISDDVEITPPSDMTYLDGKLTAKNVGTYTVTVSLKDHGSATKWANSNAGTNPYTFDVNITQATLNLTTTCSATSDWLWLAGDSVNVTVLDESIGDDVIELRVFYKDSNNREYDNINGEGYKQVNGKRHVVTMPTNIPIGNYTFNIELNGDRADNANYKLAPTSIPFTILGNDISFNESYLRWRYNGTLVEDPTQILELTYADSAYRFDVDTSNLQSLGVRIDSQRGINGLDGDISATNVNGGRLYNVKVYIVNYDSSYQEYNAIFSLTYRINKAAYDLNDLSWEYSEPLPYKTSPQSVTLSGALPRGLTATYSGNGQIPVGNYTTVVSFNVADVDNYYIPTIIDSGTYIYDDGAFPFSIDWEIVKATLTCNWKPGEDLGSGIYKLPTLSNSAGLNLDTMVTYKYYDDEDNEINLADIDVNKENTYKAVATLTESYANNYTLANYEYMFVIGQNRYPVRLIVDIADMQVPYKGSPYEANVTIAESQGGVTLSHVELKYFEKDSNQELTSAPTKVGSYRVEASLTFGLEEHNYIEDNTFEFEIVKADFDTSSLVWQYSHTDKNGNVVVATYDFEQGKWLSAEGTETKEFIYDGNAHSLELIGKDEINALVINYMNDDGDSLDEISDKNAGVYDIMLDFVFDEESYNYPDVLSMITFLIEQAEIDTSQIVWGYTDEDGEDIQYTQAFVFTRKDGIDVEFELELINLPEQLVDAISYSGNIASDAGIYTADYILSFDDDNYKPVEMSELLANRRWEISQRIINKPVKNDSWIVFDGKEHSFAQVFGIDEDGWDNYVNISVTYNDESFDGHIAINAGDYIVTFALINAGANNTNLNWAERPTPVNLVEVAQLELSITEWNGSGETSKVVLENEDYAVNLDYRYLDKDGNEVSLADMLANVEYYKEVIVKSEHSANLRISQDSITKISFSFSDGRTKIDRPTFDKLQLTYDGNIYTVEDFGMSAIENFIQVELPSDMQNAGEYKVRFKFRYIGLYCWDDGSDGVYEVTLTILKAQLPPEWNTDGETPTFVIPEIFAGLLEVEYIYYDSEGNEIAYEDMLGGESYKVVARLGEQYINNFEFVDADGEVLYESTQSEEKTFVKSEDNKEPIDSG